MIAMKSKNFNSAEIQKTTEEISFLINNRLDKLSEYQLLKVKDSHRTLMEQQIFWIFQEDYDRFLYELKSYRDWLCDYIDNA